MYSSVTASEYCRAIVAIIQGGETKFNNLSHNKQWQGVKGRLVFKFHRNCSKISRLAKTLEINYGKFENSFSY